MHLCINDERSPPLRQSVPFDRFFACTPTWSGGAMRGFELHGSWQANNTEQINYSPHHPWIRMCDNRGYDTFNPFTATESSDQPLLCICCDVQSCTLQGLRKETFLLEFDQSNDRRSRCKYLGQIRWNLLMSATFM